MTSIADLAKKAVEDVEGKKEIPTANTKYTLEVDGKFYKIKPLSWADGTDLWEDILKKIMPSVGSGLDRLQHNEILDGSPTTFTEAFIHLSRNLDGNTFKHYSMVLFEGATVDGEPLKLENQTTEFMGVWKKLFAFALKENFKHLFQDGWETGLTEMVSMVAPMMATPDKE